MSKTEREFTTHLQNILGIIESHQVQAVCVGGISLRSVLNKPVEYQRPNGTTPDIDMIGLGPNPEKIEKSQSEIKKYRQSFPDSPPVTLEPVLFSDTPKGKYSFFETLSGLRLDNNGEYYLTYRSIDQFISNQTMAIIPRLYGPINIPTLPQETTFCRYFARTGKIKPKDKEKVIELGYQIIKTGGDNIQSDLYWPYYEFVQKINKKYPIPVTITDLYWKIDFLTGSRISGSSGIFYKAIELFRQK